VIIEKEVLETVYVDKPV